MPCEEYDLEKNWVAMVLQSAIFVLVLIGIGIGFASQGAPGVPTWGAFLIGALGGPLVIPVIAIAIKLVLLAFCLALARRVLYLAYYAQRLTTVTCAR